MLRLAPYYARAAALIRSPKLLLAMLVSATDLYRREGSVSSAFDALRVDLSTAIAMVRAWANGTYAAVSTRSMMVLVAALAYFVAPTDAVPDFLPAIGLVDDATVLALVTAQLKTEINAFKASQGDSEGF